MKEVEQQAHYFAAAFLMPARDIIDELPVRADWPRLFDLKRKWQVSLGALLMRARALDRMSDNQYLTAVKAASARGWRRVEPVPLGRPEEPTRFQQLLVSTATSTWRQSAGCTIMIGGQRIHVGLLHAALSYSASAQT